MESRTKSTRILGEALTQVVDPPSLWMNASTATIYRHALDHPMDEDTGELGGNEPNAPSSWRFSIDVAKRWEESFFAVNTPNTRKIALRSAMTMSPDRGGIFDVLLRLVRFGLGGASGSGRQFVSWIHELDYVRAIDYLIYKDEIAGRVNIAAPGPLPNSEFMGALRHAWGRRIGLPAAKWMLEIGAVFLRTETELILKTAELFLVNGGGKTRGVNGVRASLLNVLAKRVEQFRHNLLRIRRGCVCSSARKRG
jgi:NAD dependent epimerase/dehydratase family enzyme